jgi:hypothetical protein
VWRVALWMSWPMRLASWVKIVLILAATPEAGLVREPGGPNAMIFKELN